jgi:serine phosphatase RsbU (regulator of sigma subunit)/Tfp pilus assembly protein PilF
VSENSQIQQFEDLSAQEAELKGDQLLAAGNQQDANAHFQQAILLYVKKTEVKKAAEVHLKVGNLFNSIDDTDKALFNFLEGLDIMRSENNQKGIIAFQFRIARLYQNLYQLANATEYFQSALKNAIELNEIPLIQEAHYALGNCLNWLEKHDEAMDELRQALSYEGEDDNLKKKILGSMGILFYKNKDGPEALNYFQRSLELNDQTDRSTGFRAAILKSMAMAYFICQDCEKAIECLDEALDCAKELPDPGLLAVIHEHYAIVFEEMGEHKKALEHFKKNKSFTDIITSENVKLKTRELQKKFDIAESQREKEIFRLKNIDLANANEEIFRQKSELQSKNRNITESIEYAKTLQRAILPSENTLKRFLKDSFILFQPKDIVSGDFYWFSGKNDRLVLAAVDCTGHGVPGAMMSILGNNLLASIVDNEGVTDPALILQLMNKRIKESLQNHESNIRANDGMDMALCTLDLNAKRLYYSGACRPLIMVRNGERIEIKGDRRSIGGFSDYETEFTVQEIEVMSGDVFYIYSDGYADQFGGTDNRKYMTSRFKKFLFDIHQLPMQKQHESLTLEHAEWKGSFEQIDDLLVIGFRM